MTHPRLLLIDDEPALADVIYQYGEERHARRIARAIVNARDERPITRTSQLASIVRRASGGGRWQRIDPATSYRVTVNNFLSVGGDGFTVLREGTNQQFGIYDADALYAYFQANSPIAPRPPTASRE